MFIHRYGAVVRRKDLQLVHICALRGPTIPVIAAAAGNGVETGSVAV